jgi:hypothetical protein
VSGNWDLTAAREEQRKAREDEAKLAKLQPKLDSARQSGDPRKVVAAVEEIVAEVRSAEPMYGPEKLAALLKLDQQDRALQYAQKLLESELSKSTPGLNELAWTIVDPDAGKKPSAKLIKLALEAARKADEIAQGKDGAIADTLAKAYFDSGDAAKALETQERAVRLLKEVGEGEDQGVKDRLEQYKKAAK